MILKILNNNYLTRKITGKQYEHVLNVWNKFEMKIFEDGIKFFEKGIKDRMPYISNRYSKANKKYFKSYGLKQESKHVIYLDANNLYGYASGFKWIDPKGFDLNGCME